MKFTFSKNNDAIQVRLTDEKISYFSGKPARPDDAGRSGGELVVGVGKKSELTHRKRILIARQVVMLAKQHNLKAISVDFKDFELSGEVLATNFMMANYEFDTYKTLPDERIKLEMIVVNGASKADQDSIAKGQLIGEEVNACRSLANTPPGLMTPSLLAEAAQDAAKGTGVRVKILDRDDMKILKMGAVLGVAQGSSEEPKFIVMEYFGTDKKEAPIVLVGKGVTFDSGGLNLKPDDHIYEMHMDMSGGAAVIHAIIAAAKLGLKRNIVALVPAVENMPSGSSYRPGDVLKSMSGATIEVLNTDAEGRVILADALTYAKQYNPALVVDVATLTGAADVAVGRWASAIFSKDEKLLTDVQKLGEESGDYVWPLPLWDEYEADIKGTFGDWANIGKTRRSGGAVTAAMFLYQFIKDSKWLHVDMAPRMTATEGEYLAKGAIGTPVRLLVKMLEELKF